MFSNPSAFVTKRYIVGTKVIFDIFYKIARILHTSCNTKDAIFGSLTWFLSWHFANFYHFNLWATRILHRRAWILDKVSFMFTVFPFFMFLFLLKKMNIVKITIRSAKFYMLTASKYKYSWKFLKVSYVVTTGLVNIIPTSFCVFQKSWNYFSWQLFSAPLFLGRWVLKLFFFY